MNKEPAILVMFLVWLLTRAIELLHLDLAIDPELIRSAAELILMIGGAILVRYKVMPVHTIRQAGLTPEEVKARAADPDVPAATK